MAVVKSLALAGKTINLPLSDEGVGPIVFDEKGFGFATESEFVLDSEGPIQNEDGKQGRFVRKLVELSDAQAEGILQHYELSGPALVKPKATKTK